jgi:hypothetical protein
MYPVVIAPSRISPSLLLVLPAFLLARRLSAAPTQPNHLPVGAVAEVHYGPGEDLERIDVGLIREAAKQIDMAAYVLTDTAIVEALQVASDQVAMQCSHPFASAPSLHQPFRIQSSMSREESTFSVYSQSSPWSSATSRR